MVDEVIASEVNEQVVDNPISSITFENNKNKDVEEVVVTQQTKLDNQTIQAELSS